MTTPKITIARFERWTKDIRPAVSPRRVLVVDDCLEIAESFAAVLEINGFDARVALGADEALGIFLIWRPNVVILDICMPEVDGIEACRRMRAAARHEASLIAHTALSVCELRAEAIAAGFDAYAGKPVSPADLAAIIDSVCPNAREWAALRRRISSSAVPL